MKYAKNLWYVAAWAGDLKPKTPFPVQILGDLIVVWRNGEGRLAALEDRCVHRLAPLSLGRCEGSALRCMYHGLLYDNTGVVVEIPGQQVIPPQARVRSYPVVERHSWIWIWMGDPAVRDDSQIPPAVGFDHPDYILGSGQLDYQAEARLINDNLLDFSHLTYIHANSFGATDHWAKERPKITLLPNGVRVERWICVDGDSPPMRGSPQAVDRYSRYDFLLPGILLMTGGGFAAGTAARLGDTAPNLEEAMDGVTFTSQAVTPMTDKTSRYFFSWGPHRKHGNEELRDILMGIAGQAFAEDRTIIEAQQRVVDATPDPLIMPTGADRAITLFNQLVARRIRDEGMTGVNVSAEPITA
jgi:phenylpropionate dioxygenase-like ring-hydroxylating dioxygenase large terminal subunit